MRLALLFITVLALLSSTADADKKSVATQKNARTSELQSALKRQRSLYEQYRAAQQVIMKDSELTKLRAASTKATRALNEKAASVSVKERQAEKMARDTLRNAIEKRIATDKGIVSLNKERQKLQKEVRNLRFEIGLTSLRLHHSDSPLQQELDEDKELAAMRKSMWGGSKETRSAASKTYYATRTAKLKSLKAAQPLFAQIDKLSQQISNTSKKIYEISKTTQEARRTIEYGKDKSLQPLRDKLVAARKATQTAQYKDPAVKELRSASAAAFLAYRKKLDELSTKDKNVANIRRQLSKVQAEINKLKAQQDRKPKKPASKPRKTQKQKTN